MRRRFAPLPVSFSQPEATSLPRHQESANTTAEESEFPDEAEAVFPHSNRKPRFVKRQTVRSGSH